MVEIAWQTTKTDKNNQSYFDSDREDIKASTIRYEVLEIADISYKFYGLQWEYIQGMEITYYLYIC